MKCIQKRRRKSSFTIQNLFVTVHLLEETLAVLSLGKLCEDHGYSQEWVSGQKPTVDQRREDNFFARRTSSYLSSFQGYSPDLEAIRRQHRHCMICQQFQLKNEVTNSRHETGAEHPQKPKTKRKRGMTVEIRTTVCEIFVNGWSSSQII